MSIKLLATVVATAVAGFFIWLFIQNNTISPNSLSTSEYANTVDTAETPVQELTPANPQQATSPVESQVKHTESANGPEPATDKAVPLVEAIEAPAIAEQAEQTAAYDIAQNPLTESSIKNLLNELRKDDALLSAVIDELRVESDPKRKKRLTLLLGELGGTQVMQFASELIYSGSGAAQMDGLNLLTKIQDSDPAAQEIVVDFLSSETESTVLVSAMNVLAMPGANADTLRTSVVNQLTPLTYSESPAVRRQSLSILSRWSQASETAPLLLAGLKDPDSEVRQAAAYASARNEHLGEEGVQALFAILENKEESVPNRRAAARALNSLSLATVSANRLKVAEAALNTR